MSLDKPIQEHMRRLRRMGWTFLSLAAIASGTTYLLPTDETIYWLSTRGKEGFYVLSALLFFLGLYCLGAIKRRQDFI